MYDGVGSASCCLALSEGNATKADKPKVPLGPFAFGFERETNCSPVLILASFHLLSNNKQRCNIMSIIALTSGRSD